MPRRAKIVATIGPASRATDMLRRLMQTGVNVFRLNLAHEELHVHEEVAARIRAVADEADIVVGVLADLPGPKMRTGRLAEEEVVLETGAQFALVASDEPGTASRVGTTVADLPRMVEEGDEIFLADGAIVLRVEDVTHDVVTEVVRGGVLRPGKGMHVPGAEGKVQTFDERDRAALRCALAMEVDMIGMSFVRTADDVARLRRELRTGGRQPMIVAKIETRSAVQAFDDILAEADAVMVARGDLGIQLPLAQVPLIQKRIITQTNCAGKPVITATQMLETMTRALLPTRAEVSDVANAILDGTDAVMLSEETAIGDDPVRVVETMADIIAETETAPHESRPPSKGDLTGDTVSWATAHAAVQAAEDLDARAILCLTMTGATARKVAAFRPRAHIVGACRDPSALGGLALSWGVRPLSIPSAEPDDLEGSIEVVLDAARSVGVVEPGDRAVVVSGGPGHRPGETDFVRVLTA